MEYWFLCIVKPPSIGCCRTAFPNRPLQADGLGCRRGPALIEWDFSMGYLILTDFTT
jgi:hypothetical protein